MPLFSPVSKSAEPTGITEVRLTSGTSWTIPTGVNLIVATWVGGGGGCATGGFGAGGGGQVKRQTFSGLTPGNTISYSIGAGGNPGSAGGTTTFNSVTATGGSAGSGNTGGSSGSGNAGGTGVSSPTARGGGGGGANAVGENSRAGAGGQGGAGLYGLGGGGSASSDEALNTSYSYTALDGGAGSKNDAYNQSGINATSNTGGGGGGGNFVSSSGNAGGKGASGIVIIHHFAF